MKGVRSTAALVLVLALLAGCGVGSSGIEDGGAAPTGVAHGVTLYFVDAAGQVRPQLRPTQRLGSISEALSTLLDGSPGSFGLHSAIPEGGPTQVIVTPGPGVIELMVPLAFDEIGTAGVEQIVCTALGVHIQSGGSRSTKVKVDFTLPSPRAERLRSCPLIRPATPAS